MKIMVRTLGRTGWSRRSVVLVLLLAMGAGAALTALPAAASSPFPPPCNKFFSVITYYSDATKTTRVGSCYTDGCDGLPQVCTGTKTSFLTLSATRCSCTN